MMKISKNKGFTLVEMSIVLLIIALVVGGVMAGRDLIATSTARKTVSFIREVDSGAGLFKLKFDGIPGDILIEKAQMFDLVAPGSDCTDTNGDGVPDGVPLGVAGFPTIPDDLGCGGNGNNLLEDKAKAVSIRRRFQWELRSFWYHLGSQNYISFVSDGDKVVGKGIPESPIAGVGVHVSHVNDIGSYNIGPNFYYFGAVGDTSTQWNQVYNNSMTPEMTYTIDSMIDDGLPDKGSITTRSGNISHLVGTIAPTEGDEGCGFMRGGVQQYNLAYGAPACQMRVEMGL